MGCYSSGGSGGGGISAAKATVAATQANRGITAEQQLNYKKAISSLKGSDIDKMSRTQLLKYAKNVALAHVGEPFYPKTADEATRQFNLLASSQSTAYLKSSLKKQKAKFTREIKR